MKKQTDIITVWQLKGVWTETQACALIAGFDPDKSRSTDERIMLNGVLDQVRRAVLVGALKPIDCDGDGEGYFFGNGHREFLSSDTVAWSKRRFEGFPASFIEFPDQAKDRNFVDWELYDALTLGECAHLLLWGRLSKVIPVPSLYENTCEELLTEVRAGLVKSIRPPDAQDGGSVLYRSSVFFRPDDLIRWVNPDRYPEFPAPVSLAKSPAPESPSDINHLLSQLRVAQAELLNAHTGEPSNRTGDLERLTNWVKGLAEDLAASKEGRRGLVSEKQRQHKDAYRNKPNYEALARAANAKWTTRDAIDKWIAGDDRYLVAGYTNQIIRVLTSRDEIP